MKYIAASERLGRKKRNCARKYQMLLIQRMIGLVSWVLRSKF